MAKHVIDETEYSQMMASIEARDAEIIKLEIENRNLKLEIEDLKNKLCKNECTIDGLEEVIETRPKSHFKLREVSSE